MLKPLTKPPSRLRRLEGALLDLPDEAMLLSDLDGFLAGLLVCPEPVDQAEWLPYVWGSVPGQELDAPFEEADDLRWFTAMVVAYRDEIARMMERGRYQPLLDVDPRNGDLLWEIWIEGFGTAMTLRPDSWGGVAGDSGHATSSGSADAGHPVSSGSADAAGAALAGLSTLIAIADEASDLAHAEIDAIADRAPELIAMWIGQLYAARLPRPADSTPLVAGGAVMAGAVAGSAGAGAAKVGRNDPCPCGSGRKWKKCCGLA